MREALHVLDADFIKLTNSETQEEITNLKKLAKKELFKCPYCNALLTVKYGEIRGAYFSHLHSEACEESKVINEAEKKYSQQITRETKLHKVLIDIIFDELTVKAKTYQNILVDYGYKVKPKLKEHPDIWVKLANKEYAISIITNVKPAQDTALARQIIKRHNYYIEQGMEPIWFIEKNEYSIEKEKNSLILWDAELTISAKTTEDKKWDSLLKSELQDKLFFNYFNYPASSNINSSNIDTRSLYYVFSSEEKIMVKVQRFLKDRTLKPFRSFLINEGYELHFADALIIENGFKLSNPTKEESDRETFKNNLQHKKKQHLEYMNSQVEMTYTNEESTQPFTHTRSHQEKLKTNSQKNISYSTLKILLKEEIGLTPREQMELWTKYMPLIGIKNSQTVWNLTVENNCQTFEDLKKILKKPEHWITSK
ncbi:Competence protein CoiA-like family [Bacillus cereus]|uniref:competence protein CoiA family protein n=1 Tax=Bacillus wiedmannii TaxID=1890302 RepID=UPI00065BA157|nr:competence protein CoiA family protein [Bacillus wiedmannii]KMP77618.1 competence protein CoiA-like family [Bacillus cereus]MCQ6544427.1 competence protein CoiA [Bacillus wiedmannii]MCQ6573867.1 competence protein CoiA [Bacillus wiedmannii]MCU5574621.1 competence protein CoiA [Bacillus wiedmannii]WMS82527.1 competence protein CoiA family protein [Bacillus wiedmannii]